MKKKLMWEPSQFSNLKFLRTETCSYGKKINNRPTPNTGIYLPHTSRRSALDPEPRLGWYDFRPVPRAHISNRRRALSQALLLCKAELGFFHILEIVTGWLVPSAGQKIPLQPGWLVPSTTEDPARWKQVSSGR